MIEQGLDPILTFSNTGATPSQLFTILSGSGSGNFPLSVDLLLNQSPDSMVRAMKSYGLNRQQPLLTLQMQIPLSEWIAWLKAQPEISKTFNNSHHNFLYIPVGFLASQMKYFGSQGALRIFSPKTNQSYRNQELDVLRSELSRLNIPKSTLVISKGSSYEAVHSYAESKKDQVLEKWGRELNPEWSYNWNEFFDGWAQLVLTYMEQNVVPAHETKSLNQIMEVLAKTHGVFCPNIFLEGEIHKRITSYHAEKLPANRLAENQVPHPTLAYMVNDFRISKDLSGVPLYSYASFVNLFGLDLSSWLARSIQKNYGEVIDIDEAMQILFRDLPPELKAEQELNWIGEFKLRSGIPRIRHYLSQPNISIRIKALKTLLKIAPSQDLSELVDILERYVDEHAFTSQHVEEFRLWVQSLDILKIPKNQEVRVEAYLRALTVSKHPKMSALAEAGAFKLGIMGKPPGYEHEIRAPDPMRRLRALLTIREAGLAQYQPYVIERINDSETEISTMALHTLGEFGGIDSVDVLKSIVLNSQWNGDRIAALEALARIGSRYALPEIQKVILDTSTSKELRMGAFRLISRLNGKHFAKVMVPFLKDDDAEIRLGAAASLLQLGAYPEAEKHFVENLFKNNNELFPLGLSLLSEMKRPQLLAIVSASGERFQKILKHLKSEGGALAWKVLDRIESTWDQLPVKNWRWFQKEIQDISPNFRPHYMGYLPGIPKKAHGGSFGKFLLKSLSTAEQNRSQLNPVWEAGYYATLKAAERGELSPYHTRIKLMEMLQGDFLQYLDAHTDYQIGEYDLNDLKDYLRPGEELPPWLQGWFTENSKKTLKFPKIILQGEANNHFEKLSDDVELLFTLGSDLLPPYLGIPHKIFDKMTGDKREVRLIPPPLLFYALKSGPGGRVNDIEMETQLSTAQQMRQLLSLRRGPLVVSNRRMDAEGRGQLHPYLLMLHDVYHLAYNSFHSEPSWQIRCGLLEIFDALGITDRDRFVQDALIDGLMEEGRLGFEDLFSTLQEADVLQAGEQERLRAMIADQFFSNPQKGNMLSAFDKYFPNHNTRHETGLMMLGLGSFGGWETVADSIPWTLAGGALMLGGGIYLAMRLGAYFRKKNQASAVHAKKPLLPIPSHLKEILQGKFKIPPVTITQMPEKPPMPLTPYETELVYYKIGWKMPEGLKCEDLKMLQIVLQKTIDDDWDSGLVPEEDWELLRLIFRANKYFFGDGVNNPEDLH